MAVAANASRRDATREAFDAVATTYDRDNRDNRLLEAMRARSVRALTAAVPKGARVLDLGCGPGTDLEALVGAGYRVTAIESSRAMVAQARARARMLPVAAGVEVRQLPIEQLDDLAPRTYDAAYSSFGPLNCVASVADVAAALAARLVPGGVLVASVIGRVCPWEVALYAWKRQPRRIAVRYSRQPVGVPLGAGTVWTRYYSPREFERPFIDAGFSRLALRGLGVFAPPPYLDDAAKRHPRAASWLLAMDDRLAGWPLVRTCGDHFLITLRRR
jgi:SAM-dependent methyltransferase